MAIEKRGNDVENRLGNVFSLADQLLEGPFRSRGPSWLRSREKSPAPSMDVSETGEEYLIELEVPGMDPDQLDLSISGHTLTISGEINEKEERSDENRDYHRIERNYGTFTRQVQLPEATETENVEADYSRGVLQIRVPKAQQAKTKKIDVNVKEE